MLEHTEDNPFLFQDSVRRPIYSLYVQDSWRALDDLTIDLGVRFDHSRLLLTESQWSPRLGASYRLGRATLRASRGPVLPAAADGEPAAELVAGSARAVAFRG